MPPKTRIKVLRGGVPVEGAWVLVDTIAGERLQTDAEGFVDISDDVTTDWRGFVLVHVQDDTTSFSMVDLKEGRTHEVELASIE